MSKSLFDILKRLITSNPSFARTSSDCIAFGVFIIGGHLALWFELCHVLPFYYPQQTFIVYIHQVVALAIYINTFSNLYVVINTPSSGTYVELCAKKLDSWHFCHLCQAYAPPRCHHCRVCSICVLKRDHHCWFAGCCIGYHNYRYYFAMLLSVSLGAIYANLFHMDFISHHFGGWSFFMVISIIIPHVSGILGYLTLHQFFIAVMSLMALLSLVLFNWLLGLQLWLLYTGQTEYEHRKGRRDYNLGLWGNLVASLGNRWYLIWLSPWLPSKLPGDGMAFANQPKFE